MNVLVIMCDQLRYDALSCNGNEWVETPNIDGLAAKSVRFTSGYSTSPICGPTRHSLATGTFPYQHGVLNNVLLPHEGMYTIAHHLKQEGYQTCCIGHMHWQRLPTAGDEDRFTDSGYDEYLARNADLDKLTQEQRNQVLWEHVSRTQNHTAGPSLLSKEEFFGQDVVNATCSKLREWVAKGERFLCWTSFHEPHPPFFPPVDYYQSIDQYALPLPAELPEDAPPAYKQGRESWQVFTDYEKRRMKAGYYGLVKLVDDYVGEVLRELDRLQLWDDTLVLFTVDHGEQLGDHGMYSKGVMREPSVHIPFMVYHPDLEPKDVDCFVEHVDVFPTICDTLGTSIPDDVEGRSVLPLMEEACAEIPWRDFAFSQLDDQIMVRTKDWKLNLYDGQPQELYNMQQDPQEFYNRIGETDCAAIIAELQDKLYARHPQILEQTRALQRSTRYRKKKRKPDILMREVQ